MKRFNQSELHCFAHEANFRVFVIPAIFIQTSVGARNPASRFQVLLLSDHLDFFHGSPGLVHSQMVRLKPVGFFF